MAMVSSAGKTWSSFDYELRSQIKKGMEDEEQPNLQSTNWKRTPEHTNETSFRDTTDKYSPSKFLMNVTSLSRKKLICVIRDKQGNGSSPCSQKSEKVVVRLDTFTTDTEDRVVTHTDNKRYENENGTDCLKIVSRSQSPLFLLSSPMCVCTLQNAESFWVFG